MIIIQIMEPLKIAKTLVKYHYKYIFPELTNKINVTIAIIINQHDSSSVTLFSKKLTTKAVDDKQWFESKSFIKYTI